MRERRWCQFCACGCLWPGNCLVLRFCWRCLLSWPWASGVRGMCRRPRKQTLLWVSCPWRETHPIKITETLIYSSFSPIYQITPASVDAQDLVLFIAYVFPFFDPIFLPLKPINLVTFRSIVPPHTWVFYFYFLVSGFLFFFCFWVCLIVGGDLQWLRGVADLVNLELGKVYFGISEKLQQIFSLPKWSLWNLDQSQIRFRLMGTILGNTFGACLWVLFFFLSKFLLGLFVTVCFNIDVCILKN